MSARKLLILSTLGIFTFVFAGAALAQPVAAVAKAEAKATKDSPEHDEMLRLAKEEPLSRLFRLVAKTVRPAVVEVSVRKRVALPEGTDEDLQDFLRRFQGGEGSDETPMPRMRPRPDGQNPTPGAPARPMPRRGPGRFMLERGLGSGVVVDAKNGYVLTNAHVVGGADEVEVKTPDGRIWTNEWVRIDAQTDLAVVKLKNPADLTEAPLGDSDQMEVGDLVMAIGSPEGLEQTVTSGIISAKGRMTGRERSYESFIQTDASINRGNSGGPLVNMRGEIVGINSAIISRTGVNEGIGFAIPSNMVKTIMKQLIETGKVVRGYLGVGIQDVDVRLAKSFGLPNDHGALVTSLRTDGPAGQAGIKEDDFITAVDGKEVVNTNELRNRIADTAPGAEVKLTIYRGGKQMTVAVKVGAQPAKMAGAPATETKSPASKEYGLEVQNMTKDLAAKMNFPEDTKGVVVTDVDADSDAYEQGIRVGMLIDQVNEKKVNNVEEFAEAVGAVKDKSVRLRVATPEGKRYVIIAAK